MRWKVLPKCCFYLTLCNLNFLLGMPQLWMYRWNNKRGMVILENKTKGNPKMRFASISNNWGFYWIVCPNINMSITPGKMNTWKKWIWWNCSAWWILGCTNVFGFFPLCLSFSFLLTFIFNASFSKCISNFILLVCSLNNTLETESIEKDLNDMSDFAHIWRRWRKKHTLTWVKRNWMIHSVHATLQ